MSCLLPFHALHQCTLNLFPSPECVSPFSLLESLDFVDIEMVVWVITGFVCFCHSFLSLFVLSTPFPPCPNTPWPFSSLVFVPILSV